MDSLCYEALPLLPKVGAVPGSPTGKGDVEGREATLAVRATAAQGEAPKDRDTLKVIGGGTGGLCLMGAIEALGRPSGVRGKGLRTNA